jgi:hypothetical protein
VHGLGCRVLRVGDLTWIKGKEGRAAFSRQAAGAQEGGSREEEEGHRQKGNDMDNDMDNDGWSTVAIHIAGYLF